MQAFSKALAIALTLISILQSPDSSVSRVNRRETLIAAHALSLDAVLVTNNTREFSRVKDLKLENWVG